MKKMNGIVRSLPASRDLLPVVIVALEK